MGTWGYYQYPSTPSETPDDSWWEEMAERESFDEWAEQEMEYEDSRMDRWEDIATDEGRYGRGCG